MQEPRRFTRRQRIQLYIAAHGKCAICGQVLCGDWHADHIQPWSKGGLTMLFNGQALCSTCSRKKGDKLMMTDQIQLRSFQLRAVQAFLAQLAHLRAMREAGQTTSAQERALVIEASPGSGKTPLYLHCANEAFRRGEIDALAIYTPRLNLSAQAEQDWAELSPLYSMPRMGRVCSVANNPPLLRYRSQFGIATTYQSLVSAPHLHLDFFRSQRVMLVGDEAQMLGFDMDAGTGTQCAAIFQQLAELATVTMIVTGTPERADNTPILLARYSQPNKEGRMFLLPDASATYLEGVREGYLKPLEAELFDARVVWERVDTGQEQQKHVSEMDRGLSAVVRDPRFYESIIDHMVGMVKGLQAQWSCYCGLIAAADQQHAQEIMHYLARRHPNVKVLLAVSDDKGALNNLRRFKSGGYDILVSVAMVLIGYSHKPISVVACLNTVRVDGWLRQLFARAFRAVETNDPDLDAAQRAYLLVPDDPAMVAIIDRLRQESRQGIAARTQVAQAQLGSNGGSASAPILIKSLAITSGHGMGLDPAQDVNAREYAILDQKRKQHGLQATSVTALKALLKDMGVPISGQVAISPATPSPTTAREMEAELRAQIAKLDRQCDKLLGAPRTVRWGYSASRVKQFLGKRPTTEDELRQALTWLKATWLPQCKRVKGAQTN